MYLIIEAYNAPKYPELMHQMFCTRTKVFRDIKKWKHLHVNELGEEIDEYDNRFPVYVMATDEALRVHKGSIRILPTTGPILHKAIFSASSRDEADFQSPFIWECSRTVFDPNLDRSELPAVRKDMLHGLCEVAQTAGMETFLGDLDALILRLYRSMKFDVEVLSQEKVDGETVYTSLVPISEEIFQRVLARVAIEVL
jgi:N-acyl-L-homoserine lactone synthetase